ncbi:MULTISPECIES: outer membrane protein assembly factor BamE [Marivita]|uniref:Outer membrane protein assembly factor BamE n=1 Tax=Marivita cryptomonadis TaxID=505252 RepID=A0A9Q2RWB9_9RHOB|nr:MULTISPECIES: outer membrane protein assembly factor BamE [Marivita]MCR9170442.1 outer membrane protein assembly factor BamE [Paracoccaceae bacterium]MBM2320732.1 outer membrane protein assembly factor BamE [Marivita cryptomonadis]MBM2330312.1 outer membrane protein assembly factor BamE [Marivita cryptomonadis]MBM2339899.1 outer membrane protein assembly factor BamE [Marivita cryptomonadis]MBM2344558.1 outer membrane protein assembly factor BamE [Marivita cryptomonadis]
MQGIRSTVRIGLVTLLCIALAGCTARYRTHGYVPSEDELQQIVPGVDTRATVEDLVGVPSTSGTLNESGFYYIESDVRHFAWKQPEVVDREVLAITFDSTGVVENIERFGLEDGQVVPIARRITGSGDGDISFIRKLFGNIGGINAADFFN